jgi:hypothetical protein
MSVVSESEPQQPWVTPEALERFVELTSADYVIDGWAVNRTGTYTFRATKPGEWTLTFCVFHRNRPRAAIVTALYNAIKKHEEYVQDLLDHRGPGYW